MIDGVYEVLKNNVAFMAHYGLTPSSSQLDIESKLIRGMESDGAIKGPRVYIYVKPGRFGRNYLVFEGKFCLDFIDKSTVLARAAAQLAFQTLHDERISSALFKSFLCELAYDSDFATGQTGMKGYEAIYDVDYLRTN